MTDNDAILILNSEKTREKYFSLSVAVAEFSDQGGVGGWLGLKT